MEIVVSKQEWRGKQPYQPYQNYVQMYFYDMKYKQIFIYSPYSFTIKNLILLGT